MKYFIITGCLVFLLQTLTGCAPVVVGAGAAGAYSVATDERSSGRMFDDSTITVKVNADLLGDPLVGVHRIDVDTVEGNVILTGMVRSKREAEQAVRVAGRVEGVKGVTNNMQVGSKTFGQTVDDKVIGSKIKAKLVREPGIRSLNIDVDVDKGVVSLTGVVDTQTNKNRIIDIARSTSGTVKVIDNIRIR